MERALTIDELLAHTSWVRDLARTMVADPATAEDLAQETLLVALRRPPEAGVPVRAWLGGVLRHVSASWRRREQRRSARESLVEPALEAASTDELVSQVEVERRIAKEVVALPEPYRRTVLLRYFRGLSSAEIARRTNTPEGTVRWRLKRGLDRLREAMDEGYGERNAWVVALLPALRSSAVELEAAGAASGASAWIALLAAAARLLFVPMLALAAALLGALALGILPRSAELEDPLALAPADRDESGHAAQAPADAIDDERRSAAAPESARASSSTASAAIELRARALDRSGKPLAGATLALARDGGDPPATSGRDGLLSLFVPIELARSSEPFETLLAAPGHLARRIAARSRGEPVLWLGDQELERAASLEGRVLDPAGEPAVHALVLIETLPEAAEFRERTLRNRAYFGSQLPDGVVTARTDGEGRFHVAALPAGYVRVWARADEGFASYSEPLALEAGAMTRCADIGLPALADAECIAGRVVAPNGAPVAGARVEALRDEIAERLFEGDDFAFRTRSDELGRFRLPVNPRPELRVAARDGAGRWNDARGVLARGGERGLELALLPRRVLELGVSDREGRPLAAFDVALHRAPSGTRVVGPIPSAGARALPLELPNDAFTLRVGARGYEALELGPFHPDDVGPALECTLERAPAMRVRVLHGSSPVEGARVVAARLVDPAGAWRAIDGFARGPRPFGCALGSIEAEGTSDAAGELELHGAPPERFWLHVIAPAHGSSLHGPFDGSRVGEAGALDVALEGTGAIEGIVLVAEGRSPAGVLVGATNGDGRIAVSRADPTGHFRFDALAPGPWQLRELARDLSALEEETALLQGGSVQSGAPPHDALVAAGETARARIDLRPDARTFIAGELLFDGRAPGPWRVEVASATPAQDARVFHAALDVAGHFELELPSAGLYTIRAEEADATGPIARIEDRIDVRAGGTQWTLALDTGLLALRASQGEEVPGARFTYWWDGPGSASFAGKIDRDGRGGGRPIRVPVGRGRLLCKPIDKAHGALPAVLEVEIEAGVTNAPLLPPSATWKHLER